MEDIAMVETQTTTVYNKIKAQIEGGRVLPRPESD